ncbi:LysR family pca operon transcriptional activator [Pseudomonas duriflava]|uniref:LysR family pca operon transcriptional activator n=1 Tax=Pseudomonas duriflava TaxID=459528 RepID=A0A562QNJ6_9PSED|nr:pca operon transcription factor PcaQ [Pseudomonas duriflava]TWI58314.1 LysR family pca operon transcriptional activator [Pseudomonas duriflava]
MNIDTRIKFRHLLCFLEVAQQRSFAKAAHAVSVSQPAISKTLKELEDILEVRLFDRAKTGVVLTQSGQDFMRYAGPCVQALRDGVSSVRSGSVQGQVVRVGVLSTVESQVMPEVIQRLHARYAALTISVTTGMSAYLLNQLKVGELDVVVGRMTDSPEIQGLNFEHLYSESMTLVVRPGHPVLQDEKIDRQRLADYPLILPLSGTTIRQYAESFFVQCGIPLTQQRLETLSPALSRRYVLQSDAIWIAPLDAVQIDIQAKALMELSLGIQEPGGSIGLCRNSTVPLPLAGQWFCETLREVATELVAHRAAIHNH